jgi:hypothetical protein
MRYLQASMGKKLGLWLLWGGAIAYAFVLAPPDQPNTFTLIQKLSTGDWAGINPLIIALFNIMGIWPMIYSCLLLMDGRMQKIPAWPFVVGSFGVGAFALLPYLALRHSNSSFSGPKTALLKLLDSRWTGVVLTLGAIALVSYGAIAGDWSDFVVQWQTSRFIHVMSLDFCLLCLLFPTVLGDDMARRGLQDSRIFWAASIPLLGPAIYLALRPPLSSSESNAAPASPSQTTAANPR